MYSPNKTAGQWRSHGRYIARESVTHDRACGFNASAAALEPAQVIARWQGAGDPRLWKFIVSPEFGERADLNALTRDLMARMEKDLGTRLEWVAAAHFNTEHPHVHIALRGIRDDKSPLDLTRDYVRSGVRAIAEDLCTRQLGYRNELDAIAAERREIHERRFTSLDRFINRASSVADANATAEHFVISRQTGTGRAREQHIGARLLVLGQMGLAEQIGAGQWRVRRDFETVLRAMQRTMDRQKMLASHGALLSDERLPLVVCDLRKLKWLEGRILVHGEDELGNNAGRHYLLLEGTDANVHLIYYTPELEQARGRGQLRQNSFVRLQKQFENGRPALEVEDLGNSEKFLRNRRSVDEIAQSLVNRGINPTEDGWGGWLGRYQATVARAAAILPQRNPEPLHYER